MIDELSMASLLIVNKFSNKLGYPKMHTPNFILYSSKEICKIISHFYLTVRKELFC